MPSDPVPDGLLACHDASIVSKYMHYLRKDQRASLCSALLPKRGTLSPPGIIFIRIRRHYVLG